jgi:hypothetical protein
MSRQKLSRISQSFADQKQELIYVKKKGIIALCVVLKSRLSNLTVEPNGGFFYVFQSFSLFYATGRRPEQKQMDFRTENWAKRVPGDENLADPLRVRQKIQAKRENSFFSLQYLKSKTNAQCRLSKR